MLIYVAICVALGTWDTLKFKPYLESDALFDNPFLSWILTCFLYLVFPVVFVVMGVLVLLSSVIIAALWLAHKMYLCLSDTWDYAVSLFGGKKIG